MKDLKKKKIISFYSCRNCATKKKKAAEEKSLAEEPEKVIK